MVQFINIRQLKSQLSEVIRKSRKGDVVVTSRGKPAAILHSISEEDIEDYLLAHSAKFQKSVNASYAEHQKKGGVSLDKLIAETEKKLGRLRR